jgi:MFS family permease
VNRLACFVELFLVLYLVGKGHSATAAGLALTAFGAGAVLGVLCGGMLAERVGSRLSIVISMVCAGGSTALLPMVEPVGGVVALSAVVGVVTQLFRPAALSLLAAAAPAADLVLVMAGYRFGLNVGAVITPLLGALLAAWSWNALFILDAVSSLAFALVAWFRLPRDQMARSRQVERTAAGSARPLRDARFLLTATGLTLIAVVEVQYVSTLPLEVHRSGMTTVVYSVLVALNGLLVIALEPAVTTRLKRWSVRRSLTTGVALIGLGIAAYGLPGGVAVLVLATIVWTVGEMIGAPAAAAYPSLVANGSSPARYLAISGSAQGLGYAIGPVLGVVVYSASPQLSWLLCAIVGVLAAACTWRGVRFDRNAP